MKKHQTSKIKIVRNKPLGIGNQNERGHEVKEESVDRGGGLVRRIMQRPKGGSPFNPQKTLKVFQDNGQDWMLHLVTKAPAILKYVDLLAEMKSQVQVESSIVTLDEDASRIFETGTPSVRKRLEIVEKLAELGPSLQAEGLKLLFCRRVNPRPPREARSQARARTERGSHGRKPDPQRRDRPQSGRRRRHGRCPGVAHEEEGLGGAEPPVIRRRKMDFGYRSISSIDWVDCQ
jgi:hypothetical protein